MANEKKDKSLIVGATSDAKVKDLQKQLAEMERRLQAEVAGRSAAEKRAEVLASSQGLDLLHADIEAVPTGKTVKVQRLKHYKEKGFKDNGQAILEPVFHMIEVPTFMYKINLPPSAGWEVSMNGQKFYHGNTYEMDIDTLRTVVDIVARNWAHERNIKGEDENERSYRQQSSRSINTGKTVRLGA